MSDIVERLRDMQCEEPCSPECCIDPTRAEAADEIERLRAALKRVEEECLACSRDDAISQAEVRTWRAVGNIARAAYSSKPRRRNRMCVETGWVLAWQLFVNAWAVVGIVGAYHWARTNLVR